MKKSQGYTRGFLTLLNHQWMLYHHGIALYEGETGLNPWIPGIDESLVHELKSHNYVL